MSSGSETSPFLHVRNVFLDRDGVINEKLPEGQYVSRWSDFRLLPGVEEALSRLTRSGYRIIIITNQRGVALGLYNEDDICELHAKLLEFLAGLNIRIDAIYYCPHDKNACDCRKPEPGMFLKAFNDFPGASVENSVMIGDSKSDIEAGMRLGMPTIFIKGDSMRQKPGANQASAMADAVAGSLLEAVELFFSTQALF
ncbi:MAG TPA: HAD family hydrolase [Alloacidobacterium sp.]|jgi:D-glycero-D-manno-heptose 1,7-bisphosphate phosphatase|nr:HAD family hydrolase [Alloacidobacterium sp.]